MNSSSLNLLPPERREILRLMLISRLTRRLLAIIGCAALLAVALLQASSMTLDHYLAKQRRESQSIAHASVLIEGIPLEESIHTFNTRLSSIQSVQREYVKWTLIIEQLTRATPAGITLSTLDLDSTTKKIRLHGIAVTRDDLLGLQNARTASGMFHDSSSPLSNLLQRDNIQFEMTVSFTLP